MAFVALTARAQVSVWTYHNDNMRSGVNTNEVILTPGNVNSTTFGKLFSQTVDGCVYAQPLYVPNVNIQGRGLHNVFFIATQHDTVYAFDADSAGAAGGLLWKTNLGAAAVTTTATYTNSNFGTRYNGGAYTDIQPEVGITGTPVIDLNTGTLYVDAFTGEVGGGVTNYFHRLHALNITNGTEQPNSPVVVTASVTGGGADSVAGKVTFNAKQQIQRCALTLAGGKVYIAYAGYADTNPYHGWLIGFDATTLQQLTNYVFNTTPNSTIAAFGANAGEGGIWMSGCGMAVDAATNLYFETGNGIFTATNNSGGTEYGDSFIKLSTTNGLAVADYFTPYNQAALGGGSADTDLGSSGLCLLPDQPGGNPHLLVGGGKEGKIYLVNRDQFTTTNNHYNTLNSSDLVVQTLGTNKAGRLTSTPAYFNGWLYFGGWPNGGTQTLKAFALTNGLFITNAVSVSTLTNSFPGQTPAISANGNSNGIVWAMKSGATGILYAFAATNLTNTLYTSSQASGNRDVLTTGIKFALPVVANGKVYVGSSNQVSVFGVLAGTVSFSSAFYTVNEANTNLTITVNRTGGTNGAIQVTYATVPGGTASSGVNYTTTSGTLSWAAGESGGKTFTIPVFNDNLAEPNPTINLALSSPTSNAALGLQPTSVLTINKTPVNAWKFAQFGTNANNAAVAGDLADPDGDGLVNLMEYALGTNPNITNSTSFTASVAASQLQLHFTRNTSASDLVYNVQSSINLTGWSNVLTYATASWVTNVAGFGVSESAPSGTTPNQFVNVTAATSISGRTNLFFRLEVNR